MILKQHVKLLFTGDSITDANREEPAYRPYGNGYVHFAANYLIAKYPELEIQVVNTGVSGNTTTQLMKRWKNDCIDHKADIITILIGINDLWRRYKTYDKASTAVYPMQYETNYRTMLDAIQASGKSEVIIIEPFMFCNDKTNEMFHELAAYQQICLKVSSEYRVKLLSIQKDINLLLEHVDSHDWSQDMVHPCTWAHAWISQRWLETALCAN